MLDRNQLETFATVAEAQSFDRAAGLLNITRGAVSQRIKALAESLQTTQLLRAKPVAATAAATTAATTGRRRQRPEERASCAGR